MAILNRYKYIIVSVLMIISILSINVIQPKAELFDSINLITNGNLATGNTTGWTAETTNTISVVSGKLNVNVDTPSPYGYLVANKMGINNVIGHKYYLSFYSDFPKGYNYAVGFGLTDRVIKNKSIGYVKYSNIITSQDLSQYVYIWHETSSYTVGDDILIDELMCIDLTATFGAGNEPNLIDCNTIYSEYFEGLKRQDIKPHDVTEDAHKTVIQMIISTMLVPIDMLKTYKVGNQISLFDIFIGMIILVILTKTILKIGGKTSSDIR